MLAGIVGILIFCAVIVIHEFGHFLAAKLSGVSVVTCCLGFGKRLWKRRVGNTIYAIGILPAGGYIRPIFSNNEDTPPASQGRRLLLPLEADELALADELATRPKGALADQPTMLHVTFLLSGLIANLLSALLVGFLFFYFAGPFDLPVKELRVGQVTRGGAAYKAGIRKEDLILSVNSQRIESWKALSLLLNENGTRPLRMQIVRPSPNAMEKEQLLEVQLFPKPLSPLLSPKRPNRGNYGLFAKTAPAYHTVISAARQSWHMIEVSSSMFANTILEICGGSLELGGMFGGMRALGDKASQSLFLSVFIFVFISLVAVLVNILPLPPSDGRYILILLTERLMGCSIPPRVLQKAISVAYNGMFVLLFILVLKDVQEALFDILDVLNL